MKKKIIVMVLLAVIVSTAVLAQPAPRQTYLAEVSVNFSYTAEDRGGLTKRERVWATDEANAERLVRDMYTGDIISLHLYHNVRDIRFIRWVPEGDITERDRQNRDNEAVARNRTAAIEANNTGTRHMGNKEYDRAIQSFNEAIRLNPNEAMIYNNRGNAYFSKNDWDRAIADFTQAIQRNEEIKSNLYHAYFMRGMAYNRKSDWDRAIADFTQAIRLEPNNTQYLNERGFAYYQKNDWDRAIADWTEAIRIKPNANSYGNRGDAYIEKQDWNRALADLNEAIRLDPNTLRFYSSRGLAHMRLDNYAQARADLDRVLRENPNAQRARRFSDELRRLGH